MFNPVNLVPKNVMLDGQMLPFDDQNRFAHQIQNIVHSRQNTDRFIEMMFLCEMKVCHIMSFNYGRPME